MKGFDFDGTLYRGDSTLDFYLFCLRKRLRCLRAVPAQLWGGLLFAAGRIDRVEFKGRFYRFLPKIEDIDGLVACFWKEHGQKVYEQVVAQSAPDDLVISASPTFLLRPFCEAAGMALIASEVDAKTGALLGPNCRGEEKVRRFREAYGDLTLDEFYTDSLADTPMTRCARASYLVVHGSIEPFPSA